MIWLCEIPRLENTWGLKPFAYCHCKQNHFKQPQPLKRWNAFYRQKHLFFGLKTLGRPILLSNFDAGNMKCLKIGAIQLLLEHDQSGHTVLVNLSRILPTKPYKRPKNMAHGHCTDFTVIFWCWLFLLLFD